MVKNMAIETIVIFIVIVTSVDVALILIKYALELRKERKELEEVAEVTYNLDPDFKSYVDKYIAKHNIILEEAFKHKLVKLYREYLKTKDK